MCDCWTHAKSMTLHNGWVALAVGLEVTATHLPPQVAWPSNSDSLFSVFDQSGPHHTPLFQTCPVSDTSEL